MNLDLYSSLIRHIHRRPKLHGSMLYIHPNAPHHTHTTQNPKSLITSPILPPRPPPLLPPPTIKFLLPQLPINLIMRLTHPLAQPLPPLHSWLVSPPAHPLLEILRADPAGIDLREQGEERAHVGLLLGRGGGRVGG